MYIYLSLSLCLSISLSFARSIANTILFIFCTMLFRYSFDDFGMCSDLVYKVAINEVVSWTFVVLSYLLGANRYRKAAYGLFLVLCFVVIPSDAACSLCSDYVVVVLLHCRKKRMLLCFCQRGEAWLHSWWGLAR